MTTAGCVPFPTSPAGNTTQNMDTISGYVISGGDLTPEGLLDAPRKFVYKVEMDNGSFVDVTYTAYPPGPVSEREGEKIRLNFHAGTILIGDYLKARGSYDPNTNTLIIAKEGDYIETYPEKP
jgi:hypothetical protein